MPRQQEQIKRTHFDINLFDHAKRRRWRAPRDPPDSPANQHHRTTNRSQQVPESESEWESECNMQYAMTLIIRPVGSAHPQPCAIIPIRQ